MGREGEKGRERKRDRRRERKREELRVYRYMGGNGLRLSKQCSNIHFWYLEAKTPERVKEAASQPFCISFSVQYIQNIFLIMSFFARPILLMSLREVKGGSEESKQCCLIGVVIKHPSAQVTGTNT